MTPLPDIDNLSWPEGVNDAGVYEVPQKSGVDILKLLNYLSENYAACGPLSSSDPKDAGTQ